MERSLKYAEVRLDISLILYGVSTNHPDIAASYNSIGNLHFKKGDYTRALEYYSTAKDMRIALYGADADHPDIADSYNNTGNLHYKMGDKTRATEYYSKKSFEIKIELHTAIECSPKIATVTSNIVNRLCI